MKLSKQFWFGILTKILVVSLINLTISPAFCIEGRATIVEDDGWARGIDWISFSANGGGAVIGFPIYDGHGNMIYTLKRTGGLHIDQCEGFWVTARSPNRVPWDGRGFQLGLVSLCSALPVDLATYGQNQPQLNLEPQNKIPSISTSFLDFFQKNGLLLPSISTYRCSGVVWWSLWTCCYCWQQLTHK